MWYHIKARDKNVAKPYGTIITFWMWATDEKDLNHILKQKNLVNIEWVREEIPPFVKTDKQQ